MIRSQSLIKRILHTRSDAEGCKRQDDGTVKTPTGFKEAYDQYREGQTTRECACFDLHVKLGGWQGLSVSTKVKQNAVHWISR
jgi:hypothetical protein